jgi:outer membrane lipopolysaccharide assembly protein LptE/RlpB
MKYLPLSGEKGRGGVRGTSLAVKSRHTGSMAVSPGLGVLLGVLAVLAGCGYQLSGQAGTIPTNLRRISVPMFTNGTAVPGLEQLVTAAVRTQLQRDGRVRLDTDASSAALLRGEVRRYELRVLATDPSIFALEYRIELEVHIALEDLQQRQTIVEQTLAVDTDYVVTSEIVQTDIARQRAVQAAARDAGERVVSFVLDRF